jgi:hypothetical protein
MSSAYMPIDDEHDSTSNNAASCQGEASYDEETIGRIFLNSHSPISISREQLIVTAGYKR